MTTAPLVYEVVAQRATDGWWAITVPELPGVFTQAKRLTGRHGASEMARDAIGLFTGVARDSVVVEVRPALSEDLDHQRRAVLAAREHARVAADDAASQVESYVRRLLDAGLSVRDAGTLLDLSPQRISQLAPQRQ